MMLIIPKFYIKFYQRGLSESEVLFNFIYDISDNISI